MTNLQEIKELAKAGNSSVIMVGNRVYEASKYAPEIVHFSSQKYLFLNHYHSGMTIEEAAEKSKMGVEEAEVFLETPKAIEYLKKRAIRDYIRKDYEEGKWVEVGNECLEGRKHLAKDQQIVFQAFGDRFEPKPRGEGGEAKTVVNFNFSPESVKEAFRRQESIETELSQ